MRFLKRVAGKGVRVLENIEKLIERKNEVDLKIKLFYEGKKEDSILELQTERMQLMSMLSTELTKQMVNIFFSPYKLSYKDVMELLEIIEGQLGEYAKY